MGERLTANEVAQMVANSDRDKTKSLEERIEVLEKDHKRLSEWVNSMLNGLQNRGGLFK